MMDSRKRYNINHIHSKRRIQLDRTKSRLGSATTRTRSILFVLMGVVCITSSSAYVVLPSSSWQRNEQAGRRIRGVFHSTAKNTGEEPSSDSSRKTAAVTVSISKKGSSKRTQAKSSSPKRVPKNQKNYNNNWRNYNNQNRKQGRNLLKEAKALNQNVIACENAVDVLAILAGANNALTGLAGGGSLNSVNFSTAIHRMARHIVLSKDNKTQRAITLSDPRFALFLCSLSEALAGMDYTQPISALQEYKRVDDKKKDKKKLSFHSREKSNVAWAIAKLRLAPPSSALPVDTSKDAVKKLLETSYLLRSQVLEVTREKRENPQREPPKIWIPTLSKLSGYLMDAIGHSVISSTADNTEFKTQEWSNLLWAFATAGRADETIFHYVATQLALTMISQQKEGMDPKPQELSNSVWAFATAGICGESEEALIRYLADMLDTKEGFVNEWKPQELSNTAWGVATILAAKRSDNEYQDENERKEEDAVVLRILRHVARAIMERADEFKSQELSNTVWAFATLGFGYYGAEAQGNDYIFLATEELEEDNLLVSRALDAVAESAIPRLRVFKSQELNNLAWAFARLGHLENSSELYAGIGKELGHKNRTYSPQDMATTLWSFAAQEYFDESVYRAISSWLTMDRASQFKPQELSNTVWALATARVLPKYPDAFDTTLIPPPERLSISDMSDDPVTVCFAAAASELMRRPSEFKAQEIKDILWGFSRVGLRHPELFKTVAKHLVGEKENRGRGLSTFSPQGLGNLSWSYAKQAQLADAAGERLAKSAREKTGRLAVYATSCIDVGEALITRLFGRIADSGITDQDGLSKLKPQDMSNTAWAFGVLGLWHRAWFEAAAIQVIERISRENLDLMSRYKGQEIANVLWAFATLNHPNAEMLDAISQYVVRIGSDGDSYDVRSIAKAFNRQELANMAWSCAVMGRYPRDLMHFLYTGLIGEGKESDPEYLARVYGDGGMQKQAVVSLLYIQMVMDIEEPDNDLALPPNFPDGWVSDIRLAADDSDDVTGTEASSMLSLSSSKTQKDVSAAFDRIGFDHVQEYAISTKELVQNHGIQLSSKPLEVLSIDLANLEDRIGIEVDGPSHFITNVEVNEDDSLSADDDESRSYAQVVNGKLEWQFIWQGRQEMNGPTALKERLLTHLGWKLIHLPFWEWYKTTEAQSNSEDRYAREEEYCRELLQRDS